MCGINGFNFKDEELLKRMNKATAHRGPDSTGIFVDEKISLGHNRLKIIDLSDAAKQPMDNNQENLVISFNGEIYNFQELKEELKDEYQFKTQSDTEVILAAYEKWGQECVNKFNGIFAFAIWDKEKEEIFLARDFIGVKPLYYFQDNERFIFSSEIKGILEHREVPRILDQEAFNHYMRVLYVPEPLTMFKNIYKFPPASIGIFKNGKLTIKKYWQIERKISQKSKKENAKSLRETLLDSTKRQLISDRPVGVYLSGGIDSSSLLYCMSQFSSKIKTFSVGFELSNEEQKEKFNQDFYLAKKTAKHFQTNHYELLISSKDVVKNIEKMIWHLDEPISNPTNIPMYCLAKYTKNEVAVALGGDGGDELFGGYERYRLSLLATYFQKMPSLFRKPLEKFSPNFKKLNTSPGIERFVLFMFLKDKILNRVLTPSAFDNDISKSFFENKFFKNEKYKDFESLLLDVDRKSWLVDESLMRTDKMSMAFGLEVRVPILDRQVVELSYAIPREQKVTAFDKKIILKQAFRDVLPDYLFHQPKRGWFAPGAKWLRNNDVYNLAREVLSSNYYEETNSLFKWDELKKVLEDHYSQKEYNFTVLWAIITFQIWAKLYNVKLK